MIRVAVCGACGRMGRLIIKQISQQRDMKVVAAIDAPGTPEEGRDAGELAGVGRIGVQVAGAEKLPKILAETKPDVLVDFTVANAAVENVQTAAGAGVSVVVGTTGFTEEQRKKLEEIVQKSGIKAVISPNMSVGVNVFFKTVADAAKKLGKGYAVEITEIHHVHKKDAPSGTAKRAAELVAEAMGIEKDSVKITSIREGEVVGDHLVKFSNEWEELEVIHRAKSRETFAAGVIRAIRHVSTKGKPGKIESMFDVLGLE
ncbi:MAG: 4-hydroxy-tetrahydrodipicolinate reductase [Candidatus Hadarchaeales archaeon]